MAKRCHYRRPPPMKPRWCFYRYRTQRRVMPVFARRHRTNCKILVFGEVRGY